jgi:mannose-6-phosphate isomerase-like protein (cupin superfamily)
MKVLTGGCRVFSAEDGETSTHGNWTARARVSQATGAEQVTQTIYEYAEGRSPTTVNPIAEEVLYVAKGQGVCFVDGFSYDLRPGIGVFIPPGSEYCVENSSPEPLQIVSACCPEDPGRTITEKPTKQALGTAPKLSVCETDRESQPATAGRDFRFLVWDASR